MNYPMKYELHYKEAQISNDIGHLKTSLLVVQTFKKTYLIEVIYGNFYTR